MTAVEKREKFLPAEIKLNELNEFFVEQYNKNIKVRVIGNEVLRPTPKTYKTECFIDFDGSTAWYSESLSLNTGSTTRKCEHKFYFKEQVQMKSESITTEINTTPRRIYYSECVIPIEN